MVCTELCGLLSVGEFCQGNGFLSCVSVPTWGPQSWRFHENSRETCRLVEPHACERPTTVIFYKGKKHEYLAELTC